MNSQLIPRMKNKQSTSIGTNITMEFPFYSDREQSEYSKNHTFIF